MQIIPTFVSLIFVIQSTNSQSDLFEVNRYLPLVYNVHKYYRTSAVLFLQSRIFDKDLETKSLCFKWNRIFSELDVITQCANFEELWKKSKYRNRSLPPLIVVPLHNNESVLEFSYVTKSTDMSLHMWLIIFLKESVKEIDYCRDPPGNLFNLAFNVKVLVICDGDITVRDWYATHWNQTRIIDLAVWKEQNFSLLIHKSLYERRNDMEGMPLRAVYVQKYPYVVTGICEENRECGFLIEIMNELKKVLNFSLDVVQELSQYGTLNSSTNKWTGAVDQLIRDNADIGIADFTMSSLRLEYVDYTIPLFLNSDCLFIKTRTYDIKWTAYFKPFHLGIWLMLILIIVIATFSLTLMRMGETSERFMSIAIDNYLYVWGIFCQQGLSDISKKCSVRLACFWILICSSIIISAYSAKLISFMTVYIPAMPFISMEDFVKDNSYKLITEQGSAEYDFFAHTNESLFKKALSLMESSDKLPHDRNEAFKQVCTGRKIAYYANSVQLITIPCTVVCIPCGRMDSTAMIIKKRNPYTAFINHRLEKFFASGIMNRYKRLSFRRNVTYGGTKYKAVSFKKIIPLITIFAGGLTLSIFLLIIEIYCKK